MSVFARGGYATVYRANQEFVGLGREVAVKVENRTLDSERDQRRFLREARAAGRMSSHPHVVDLFDAGVTVDQHPYLIMELCDGSYADRMRTSPLGAAETRDLGVKIADALAAAHQLGVLHRDVKPANILYSRFGEPALADFGLAVLAEARDSSVTLEVLTPAYAPPEMFRHCAPSPAVDVYALCATLYAVMRGKPPRWRDDHNPSLITLMEMFSQPIPDLPGIPSTLVDLLRYGMANDPAARPTAEQLRDLLAALPLDPPRWFPASAASVSRSPASAVHGPAAYAVPGSSWPPSSWPGPTTAQPVADSTPTVPTLKSRTRRRPGWLLAGLGGLALLAVIGTGTWYEVDAAPGKPSPTGIASSSAAPGATPSLGATPPLGAGGSLRGCRQPLPGGGRCPGGAECFGPTQANGPVVQARRVPCAGRHTWEAFAVGDLPVAVTAADHAAVLADPTVRQVCGENTFRAVTLRTDTAGWRFEVLPPDPQALEIGDRTYRCLAGRGPDQLIGFALTG